ncbi:MAG: LPXTG cell wall anchor domain-containing protein [Oscillospiraceae bacterium]|nr:LPXTG cell wall anchor domain-containing protein [Oscillospiraceae bacterium]
MKKLLSAFLITVLMLGLASNAGASAFPLRDLGTWTGGSDISIYLPYDPSAFSRLLFWPKGHTEYGGEKVVDPSNYIVSEADNSTDYKSVIILKQEYLETLANREHLFTATFAAEGLWVYKNDLTMQTETTAIVPPLTEQEPDSSEWKLKYGDEDVDSAYYTIEKMQGGYICFIFDEEYIKGLSGEHSFWAYYIYNNYALDLILLVDVPPPTEPPSPPTTAPPTEYPPTVTAPQTGDDTDALAWTIVFVASMLGMCAMLAWRKRRKTKCRTCR